MSQIKIEKGIPVPTPRNTWPMRDMKVGDSFAVPIEQIKDARQAVANANRKLGRRFVSRSVVEKGKEMIRCWRVE